MLCPKCGRQVIPELKKCNYCQYDFIKAFNKYKKWELRTHKKIRKYRINYYLSFQMVLKLKQHIVIMFGVQNIHSIK